MSSGGINVGDRAQVDDDVVDGGARHLGPRQRPALIPVQASVDQDNIVPLFWQGLKPAPPCDDGSAVLNARRAPPSLSNTDMQHILNTLLHGLLKLCSMTIKCWDLGGAHVLVGQ